jgi:hypothetical protein
METPVIYFYAPPGSGETRVSASVAFHGGEITEFYPRIDSSGAFPREIRWGTFAVVPDARPTFLKESGPSHYYAARETDATPIRVCGTRGDEWEKFLFYRGVGTFDLPLRVSLEHDELTLESRVISIAADRRPIAIEGIVFERKGDEVAFTSFKAGKPVKLARRTALARGTLAHVEGDLMKLLVAEGLYEKEARAMIATWRDTWFEDGLRVFYLTPRRTTDEVLPLTLKPAPQKLVRVLVGRAEVVTPEMESALVDAAYALADPSPARVEAARAAIARWGRFARPILQKVLDSTKDPVVREKLTSLLIK